MLGQRCSSCRWSFIFYMFVICMMNHPQITTLIYYFECAGCGNEEIFCSTITCHLNMSSGNITGNSSQLSCRPWFLPMGFRMEHQPSHCSVLCKFACFPSTRENRLTLLLRIDFQNMTSGYEGKLQSTGISIFGCREWWRQQLHITYKGCACA